MALKTIDLGPVSSYAIAVEKGYTGTEAEWYELIHSVTDNAQTASDAAVSAGASAASAAQSLVDVNTAKTAAIAAIQEEGETQSAAVAAEGTTQVGNIQDAKDLAVAAVQAQQGTSVQAVYDKGTEQVERVEDAGDAAVGDVDDEKDTVIAAVQAKGDEVIASIPEDYTELTEEVGSLKSAVGYRETYDPISFTNAQGEAYGNVGETISFDTLATWKRTSFAPEQGGKYRITFYNNSGQSADRSYIFEVDSNNIVLAMHGEISKTQETQKNEVTITPLVNTSTVWIRGKNGSSYPFTIDKVGNESAVDDIEADVEALSGLVVAANDRIDHLISDINQQAFWENGSLSNGANTSNDTRLRTITYLQNGVQKITASNGYDFVVCCYNPSTNAYVGIVKEDGTVGTANFYWHTSVDVGGLDYKMRLILRNPEDTESDMPLSAYANVALLSAVDAGLVTSGAGADAKVTGERLAALDAEAQYGHYSVRRNNPEYVSAMMTIAQSYMAANSDTILRNSKHFEYGNNSILQVSTSTNLIDCSTFVGLVMRGYALSETSYMADVSLRNPSAWVAKSGVAWAIDPFDFKVVSKPGEDPSRLRWASQLAEWMIERSQVVPMSSGLAEVMPGDILFWARKDASTGTWVEPLRYRHISHVGFCLSRTKTPSDDADVDATVYPYKHMTIEVGHETYDTDGVTVLEGCVKSKLLEAEPADPADWETTNNIHTLVLVCRPDLGSI